MTNQTIQLQWCLFLFLLCVGYYSTNGLRCFTCIDAISNEKCNTEGEIVFCASTEKTCQNEVRLGDGFKYLITKRCKQKTACHNNQAQNDKEAWEPTQCNPAFTKNSVCRCCCESDLCNKEAMPCDKKSKCPALDEIENGQSRCTDLNFLNSVCRFNCNNGYTLIGSQSSECTRLQRGAGWDANLPFCKLACPKSEMELTNGTAVCSDANLAGSICIFECFPGHLISENTSITCQTGGRWNKPKPSCTRVRCDESSMRRPNSISNCSDTNFFQSSCNFECLESFIMEGVQTITCQADGNWSSPTPKCIKGRCVPELMSPENGTMVCTDENYSNSTCSFSCGSGRRKKGWSLYGGNTSTCSLNTNNGRLEWTNPQIPCCARQCPPHALVDLFLILDSSSSVGRENWNRTLIFIKDVIDNFEISEDDMLVAAIRYNRMVDIKSEIKIGQYVTKEETTDAIMRLPYDGSGTHTGKALNYVLANMLRHPGNRMDVNDIVFVVTDGISTDDVIGPAQSLRNFGATVIALGVVNKGGTLKEEDITEIAGSPEAAILIESGFEGLSKNVVDLIDKKVCGENPCI